MFHVLIVLIFCQSDTLIPQIVGFYFTKLLQNGEFFMITFNLRKTLFSIEISIPQIAGFSRVPYLKEIELIQAKQIIPHFVGFFLKIVRLRLKF